MNTGFMSTNVGVDTGGDPFEIVFRLARPTLDTVVQMRTPLSWLRGRQKQPPLDVKRASQHRMEAIKRCELIPMDGDLCRAGRLFEQAEAEPAPELWMHLVLGVWLSPLLGARLGRRHTQLPGGGWHREPDHHGRQRSRRPARSPRWRRSRHRMLAPLERCRPRGAGIHHGQAGHRYRRRHQGGAS
jgi:hypothetical protein